MIDVVILAAGPTDEFTEDGYRFPKNLIEVGGVPLIGRVIESRSSMRDISRTIVCISHSEDLRFHTSRTIKLVAPDASILLVKQPTKGALCTSLLAIDLLEDSHELVLLNGDSLIFQDLAEIITHFRQDKCDAGTICFESIHPRFSFVRLSSKLHVTEVAEKRPISRYATAGFYWFRSASDFKKAAFSSIRRRQDVDGRFYVAPVLNELILDRKIVGARQISSSDYANLQSPKLIEEFRQKIATRERQDLGKSSDISS